MDWSTRVAISAVLVGILGWGSVAHARTVMPQDPMPWVIESAEYTGKITEQIARIRAILEIRVIRDGWTEVPLPLQGVTMTNVELVRKSSDAHLAHRGGQYVFTSSKKGTYKVKLEFSIRLAQDSQHEGVTFSIPQASFSTLTLTVPRKDVELRESEQLYVERRPDGKGGGVILTARLAATDRIDVRWSTKPATPVKVEPILYGEVHTLAVLEEQLAHLTSIIDYRITQGETRELTVQLPKTFQVLNVRGAGIEEWRIVEQSEGNLLEVKLNFTLKDAGYRLAIEGEQALQAEQTSYPLPEIILVGAKQERGQLAVATSDSLEVTAGALEGLTRIDVKEVSDTLRSNTVFPILLAFRYHQHPYQASLNVTRYEDLAVLNAIAEAGELVTIVSRQGELLTRAAYAIRANKKQFLGVVLPDGSTLWSCIVDGRSVKPVEGTNGQLLVPLATTKGAEQPILVELVYFEQRPAFSRVGTVKLNGPILDVPTTIANWLVYTPKQMKFLRVSGNLEKGASALAFIEEPLTQVAIASAPATGGWLARKPMAPVPAAEPVGSYDSLVALEGKVEDRSNPAQNIAASATRHAEVAYKRMAATGGGRDRVTQEVIGDMVERIQEAGIFPLKIRLPKAGTVHRFNRLMTAQEALELDALFVNLPTMVWPFAGIGLLLLSSSGAFLWRFWKP